MSSPRKIAKSLSPASPARLDGEKGETDAHEDSLPTPAAFAASTAVPVLTEQLMHLMPVGVVACDAGGRFTFYNRRAAELWGREPRLNDPQERFCAAHRVCLADGTVVPPTASPMAIALRDGRSFREIESVIERPDGTKFVVTVNIDPLRDAAGAVTGAIEVFQDISNRKRLEEKLRRREAELRLISDNVPVMLAHCDREHRIVFVNRAGAQRFGGEPAELIGRTIPEVAGQETYATILPYIERVLRGEAFEYEIELTYPDLGPRFMRVAYVPDYDEDGTVCGWLSATTDITERHRSEVAQRESEKRYRELVQVLPGAVCTCDVAGRITFYNDAAATLWGFRPEPGTPLGQVVSRAFRPDGSPVPPEQLPLAVAVRENRAIRGEELIIQRADGTRRIVLAHPVATRDDTGKINGGINMLIDITEHRRAEETARAAELAFHQSEERLRMATRTGKIGIWDWQIAENRVTWSDSLYEIHGVKRESFDGTAEGFAALLHPEDAGPVQRAIRSSLEHDVPYELEFRAVRPDGRTVWLFTSASVLRENGRPVRMFGATLDITARKAAELGLRASEKRFRTLASHAPVGIFLTDPQGQTIFVNESWCAMTGLTAHQARGAGWAQAIHPEDRERVAAGWREAVRAGVASNAEYRFQHADGSITWVQGQAVQLRESDGRLAGYIGTIADLTQRKAAEEALRESQAQLQAHATELERKVQERTASLREAVLQMEEFSYSVSHDLRAPLRAMNGYAEALAEDYGDRLDATARGYLERIQRSSLRMEKLTHDMLTYSRVARSDLELAPVDLVPLLKDLVNQYAELQPPAAELDIRTPLHPVLAHESSLGQCLANLLTNAVKFVAPGVRPRIRVRSEPTGDRVRIWIEDNGIGVEPRYQPNLFRVFERVPTPQPYEGTGIGLAVVRKAAEKMGGQCGVESDGRSGSRFWIEVPRA